MVAEPAATPLTEPAALIVAMDVLLLLQVPPETVSDRLVELPRQSALEPDITPAGVDVETVNETCATPTPQPEEII